MSALEDGLVVPDRFCGPPTSGNGGWVSGALAGALLPGHDHGTPWPAITVTLRRPPPLDVAISLTAQGDPVQAVEATDDGSLVARAALADHEPPVVAPVTAAVARAAEATYPGLTSHPFPTCFGCGTGREEGDGLRIFPGRVDDADGATRIAATWVPHPSVAEDWHSYTGAEREASLAVTWSALDCVGGWAGDLTERMMVLGTMTTRIHALPVVGEEHVVVGSARGSEGRKTFTSSALYAADGRLVGSAEHVWIAVGAADFG